MHGNGPSAAIKAANGRKSAGTGDLAARLAREITGGVHFDAFKPRPLCHRRLSCTRSCPKAVVIPKTIDEALRPPGNRARKKGGPSRRAGAAPRSAARPATLGIVVDFSKHLNNILSLDVERRTCVVEPGIVLDDLNRRLKKHGLWFPVDVSTASRATIGGMAGNNSCGGRSLRYGTMRDNTLLAGRRFSPTARGCISEEVPRDLAGVKLPERGTAPLSRHARHSASAKPAKSLGTFPKVQRRVGGYNLDALVPAQPRRTTWRIPWSDPRGRLRLQRKPNCSCGPVIRNKVLGVCHFGSFYEAMDAAQHLVKLRPIAVELVDRTMIALGRDIAMFQPVIAAAVRGDPDAHPGGRIRRRGSGRESSRLKRLGELIGDLGFGWDKPRRKWGGVVEVVEPAPADGDRRFPCGRPQRDDVDEAGGQTCILRRGLRCAAAASGRIHRAAECHFREARHAWARCYAHASEGCLHVRPVLNLKLEKDVKAMRAIAEETFSMVREYKGSHSGEHGDGIVRSRISSRRCSANASLLDFKEVKRELRSG